MALFVGGESGTGVERSTRRVEGGIFYEKPLAVGSKMIRLPTSEKGSR